MLDFFSFFHPELAAQCGRWLFVSTIRHLLSIPKGLLEHVVGQLSGRLG
jgi:hypothetical protein